MVEKSVKYLIGKTAVLLINLQYLEYLVWACVFQGGRAEQTLLFPANGTLEEKNKWLVAKEEKTQPLWTLICFSYKIISVMEIGSVPLGLKRMCASLIDFDIKNTFLKAIPPTQTFVLLMSSDFGRWQYVRVWGTLRKKRNW